MYIYYIIEIQKYLDGTFGHIIHWANDDSADKARLKAESKYYEVLAAAAISDLPQHAVSMISSEGFPIMNKCYRHAVQEPVPEETQEPEEPEAPADEG